MPKADGPKGSIADQEGDASLPLFPLQTVLFPGGELGLRIFEPRYLDMIARAMREASSFGVVAIRDGTEVGPADFYAVGTTARKQIDRFHKEPSADVLRVIEADMTVSTTLNSSPTPAPATPGPAPR